MITEHLREKQDRVSSTPKTIEVEEKCYNDSGNSLNANVLDHPWTLSDLLTKEERLDTIEVKEDGLSSSVIVDVETSQGEAEGLALEEKSPNKPKILDCTMTSQQQACSEKVGASDENNSISITIDNDENDEGWKDIINEKN